MNSKPTADTYPEAWQAAITSALNGTTLLPISWSPREGILTYDALSHRDAQWTLRDDCGGICALRPDALSTDESGQDKSSASSAVPARLEVKSGSNSSGKYINISVITPTLRFEAVEVGSESRLIEPAPRVVWNGSLFDITTS